jgi:RHS repeat-associated protein
MVLAISKRWLFLLAFMVMSAAMPRESHAIFNTYQEAQASCQQSISAMGYYHPAYTCVWEGYWDQTPGSTVVCAFLVSTTADVYSGLYKGYGWTTYFCDQPGNPTVLPPKNLGVVSSCNCSGSVMVGEPINTATGNEFHQDDDYLSGRWLQVQRFYNSDISVNAGSFGSHWRDSYDRILTVPGTAGTTIVVMRADGAQEIFIKSNGVWTPDSDIPDTLTEQDDASGTAVGYTLFVAQSRQYETYSTGPTGLLQSVVDESGQGVTFAYSTRSTPSSIAPRDGLLLTATDSQGRQLKFTYNSTAYVSNIALPDGGTLTYGYDGNGNLTSVQYPDGKTRQYLYNEPSFTGGASLFNAMTGVIDEAGARYETISYSGSGSTLGQATSSSFAGNVGSTQVAYNTNGTSTVTYPLGLSSTIGIAAVQGKGRVASITQACGPQCSQPYQSRTYDTNGYPDSYTDFNNNVTKTTYDARGLLDQEIDAFGSSNQRTITTTWNTTLRVPLTRITQDNNSNTVDSEAWTYNATGLTAAHCQIDPAISGASSYNCGSATDAPSGVRQSTYNYCTAVDSVQCPLVGLMLTATGPRTDVTQTITYSYYLTSNASGCSTPGGACHQAGDLHQVTGSLGHVTTIASYDADGRATRITDANGVNTDMTYTPRGWLATRSVGGATTTLHYTPYGSVDKITDPDNVTMTFTYDGAHRLTDITDAQGNVIHYTLDAAGNKTAEQIRTASGTVVHSLSRTYNTLGQITAIIDGLSHTVFNAGYTDSYDANGNLVHSADALGVQRQQGFDALNRLVSAIDNYNGTDTATRNTTTALSLDALDRVDGVADPSGLDTLSTYDAFGDRKELQSPDTGTSTATFDAAGNRVTHTDANGIVSTSTYDALNRLASTSYIDTTLNATYDYDQANTVTSCSASAPIGRLTRVIENAVTTVFCYDNRGNVSQKKQVITGHTDVTQYTYTAANRLSRITTPDLTATAYTYDNTGRPSGVTVTPSGTTSASPTVVSAITWLPFDPIASYTLGNGQTVTRSYDANYQLTDLTSPALNLHFAHDAMGNITALGNAAGASPATETYGYDSLYRLKAVTEAGGTTLESYTYNPTGDRLSKTASGIGTGTYGYTTGTHQLASIGNGARANDAKGNTTASVIGGETFGYGYNGRNRMTVAQRNGDTVGSYTYDAFGERIGKVAAFPSASTERYAYNQSGQLIGEYGTTNRDYLWLGDLPIAIVDNTTSGGVTTSTVNYVTADQLGTPRVVTDGTGTVVWSWAYQGNPWGEQQPTSTSGYVLNLRYPGQYYDAETGTNYNYFRTYEPATGRYLQPDPMGQAAGPSLYGYVGGSPYSYTDSLGLFPEQSEDPKVAEELNTPEINAEIAKLDEQRAEKAREEKWEKDSAAGKLPGRFMPMSEFGPHGMCRRGDFDGDGSTVGPIASNGATTGGLLTPELVRIQNAADRGGVDINLVGSRATNTAGPNSDWDYVIDANAKTRNSLSRSLPGAGDLSEGVRPNLDVFSGSVNPGAPSIKFTPRK